VAGIYLKKIHKIYPGGIPAVYDFNLDVEDREFLVIVGPSGCGKSTLLRMIAGLEEISSGELFIGGVLVNNIAPKDRDIAMVFQNYALYPHMTVYKNIAFGLKLRKMSKAEINKKVLEAAKLLGIEDILGRKPKALSGGQCQRVALGRAMVRQSTVFLLDEPLSNLDAKLRATMRSEISKLHRRLQTTFVYVTHDQTEAMTMADRIVVMRDGMIQQVDTPQRLYRQPRNQFIAAFIGTPQMNFLPVTICKTDERYMVLLGKVPITIPPQKVGNAILEAYVGKECVLGIRPEHIHFGEGYMESIDSVLLDAEVELVAMMGAEIYLYLSADGHKFMACVPSHNHVESGEKIRVSIDTLKLHLFDQETQEIIFN